jgi:hypothetical protein
VQDNFICLSLLTAWKVSTRLFCLIISDASGAQSMPQTLPGHMTNQNQGYGSLPPQIGGEYQQGAYNMQGNYKILYCMLHCTIYTSLIIFLNIYNIKHNLIVSCKVIKQYNHYYLIFINVKVETKHKKQVVSWKSLR